MTTENEVTKVEVASKPDPSSTPTAKAAEPAKEAGPPPVSFRQLLRFADWLDILMVTVGYTCAIAGGLVSPLSALVLGELFNAVSQSGATDFSAAVNKQAGYLALVALGSFLFNFFGISLACLTAERQARRVRIAYMRGILR